MTEQAPLYYKYRDTTNMLRLLDIIFNNRLYATDYKNLNDPMEGKFLYSGLSKENKQAIKSQLDKTLICSLSTSNDNGLMWTHYANEHKGCCLEVKVTATSWHNSFVNYPVHLPIIEQSRFSSVQETVESILFQKSEDWKYENEVRFIKERQKTTKPYLAIRVTCLFLGLKMDKKEENLIRRIIELVNKGKEQNAMIQVYKMKDQDINFGYK